MSETTPPSEDATTTPPGADGPTTPASVATDTNAVSPSEAASRSEAAHESDAASDSGAATDVDDAAGEVSVDTDTDTEGSPCPTCGRMLPADAPAGMCPYCLIAPQVTSGRPRLTPPSLEELAPHFPELELQGELGHGGMGVVFLARQAHLDRLVALKVLPPEIAEDPSFQQRFAQEARALAKLQHPNVVAIYDFGQRGPYAFLLMEYIDGVNLRELMSGRPLPPETALAIVPALCDALQYAHERGIVHRDVKPENILIAGLPKPSPHSDNDGTKQDGTENDAAAERSPQPASETPTPRLHVKIADFGLARVLAELEGAIPSTRLTGTRQVMGTPHYMAPEQFERPREADHRVDVFALGVVFYEMLTGRLPLGRFEPPSESSPVGPRVDHVVLKSLEREPQRRYDSTASVRNDLESDEPLPDPEPAAARAQPPHDETVRQTVERWARGGASSLVSGVRSAGDEANQLGWLFFTSAIAYFAIALSIVGLAQQSFLLPEQATGVAALITLGLLLAVWTHVRARRLESVPIFAQPASILGAAVVTPFRRALVKTLARGGEFKPLGFPFASAGEPTRTWAVVALVVTLFLVLTGVSIFVATRRDDWVPILVLAIPFVWLCWAWSDRIAVALGLNDPPPGDEPWRSAETIVPPSGTSAVGPIPPGTPAAARPVPPRLRPISTWAIAAGVLGLVAAPLTIFALAIGIALWVVTLVLAVLAGLDAREGRREGKPRRRLWAATLGVIAAPLAIGAPLMGLLLERPAEVAWAETIGEQPERTADARTQAQLAQQEAVIETLETQLDETLRKRLAGLGVTFLAMGFPQSPAPDQSLDPGQHDAIQRAIQFQQDLGQVRGIDDRTFGMSRDRLIDQLDRAGVTYKTRQDAERMPLPLLVKLVQSHRYRDLAEKSEDEYDATATEVRLLEELAEAAADYVGFGIAPPVDTTLPGTRGDAWTALGLYGGGFLAAVLLITLLTHLTIRGMR